jgi:hypothetical protein
VRKLVGDMRLVMLPHTAQRLHERKRNSIKDFVDVASILGVTHFLLFSSSAAASVCVLSWCIASVSIVTHHHHHYRCCRCCCCR